MHSAPDNTISCATGRAPSRFSLLAALSALLVAAAIALLPTRAEAISEARAATGLPYEIAVFLGSNPEQCYRSGTNDAIRKIARQRLERINHRGGIGGRPVRVQFYDDQSNAAKTLANMREALATPELVGMIGLTSSDRGEVLFKEMSDPIKAAGVPYITDLSVSNLFAGLPNVFSTRPSQDEGNAPIITAFLKDSDFTRVATIVNDSRLTFKTLGEAVAEQLRSGKLVGEYRIAEKEDRQLDADGVKAAVADIKAKSPDFILLAVGASRAVPVLKALTENGTTPPVMMTGTLESLPAEVRDSYPNSLFELTQSGLPEVENAALGELVSSGESGEWLFPRIRQKDASGWKDGKCKPEDETALIDPLAFGNRRAIERGMQFADMVELIVAGANAAAQGSKLEVRRSAVIDALTRSYASGKGAFRGELNSWSFDARERVAVRPTFVVMLPTGMSTRRRQLAPLQYVRLRDGKLRRIDTLYMDIDLIRAHSVDDSEKTFLAEFYLAMRANKGADISRLDFTNAYVDPRSNGRQIAIEELHDGSANGAFPEHMKIYRVSGRFQYEPDLAAYPFDTQRFAINVKPRGGSAFLVQPPPAQFRDTDVASDDWQSVRQFVGLAEDFVPVVDAYKHEPGVVPFYSASFNWLMKREVKDYYLRVVVPLAFILLVAYVSIFIPAGHFEAIVTIQVTALLSAVALYLSLPQLDSDTATLSDRLFVDYYFLISAMILVTILRIHPRVTSRHWLSSVLGYLHVAGIPALVAWIAWNIYLQSLST